MKYAFALIVIFMAQTATAELKGNPATIFKNGRSVVTKSLVDPDSAKFRNEYLVRNTKNNRSWMCGEVNAKNRYGGYAGFTRYVTAEDWSYLDSNGDEEVIDILCNKTIKNNVITEIDSK